MFWLFPFLPSFLPSFLCFFFRSYPKAYIVTLGAKNWLLIWYSERQEPHSSARGDMFRMFFELASGSFSLGIHSVHRRSSRIVCVLQYWRRVEQVCIKTFGKTHGSSLFLFSTCSPFKFCFRLWTPLALDAPSSLLLPGPPPCLPCRYRLVLQVSQSSSIPGDLFQHPRTFSASFCMSSPVCIFWTAVSSVIMMVT